MLAFVLVFIFLCSSVSMFTFSFIFLCFFLYHVYFEVFLLGYYCIYVCYMFIKDQSISQMSHSKSSTRLFQWFAVWCNAVQNHNCLLLVHHILCTGDISKLPMNWWTQSASPVSAALSVSSPCSTYKTYTSFIVINLAFLTKIPYWVQW